MIATSHLVVSLLWLVLAVVLIWAGFLLVLLLLGRRGDAKVVARFIPDMIVLFKRLLGDKRVPRRRKAVLWLTIGYLALPIDLVPDFIPLVGQLDDAIVVALVLRWMLRGVDPAVLDELWPGPAAGLALLKRGARLGTRHAEPPAS
jgi:uncharacterized membrane protein YkvA (DUF1232 family)